MEKSEIYNGSQWAHDIFLVNKAGATEYITGRSSTQVLNFVIRISQLLVTFAKLQVQQ